MCAIYFCKGDVTKFIFGMWVILTVFGRFSGAHVNPAITMGFFIHDGNYYRGFIKLLFYWVGQFFGALAGAMVSRGFYKDLVYVTVPVDQSLFHVVYTEFFFTGCFLFVILYVCSPITTVSKSAPINCAVIVGWFYFLVNAGATISGAAYNPAILAVLNILATTVDSKSIQYIIYMIGAQLVGAIVFALIFRYLFEAYHASQSKKE
jgi:glycerol uptake facilitator-like aquaporin